jgi:hypothetical protein
MEMPLSTPLLSLPLVLFVVPKTRRVLCKVLSFDHRDVAFCCVSVSKYGKIKKCGVSAIHSDLWEKHRLWWKEMFPERKTLTFFSASVT